MLDKVLNPFTYIMSRLKYGQKFAGISLLFMIPAVITLYLLISDQLAEIRQVKAQQIGVEQVRDLMPFMLQVQQHRGLVNGYLNGNADAKDRIDAKQQEIAQLIENIESGFRKDELPGTYEAWVSVRNEWEALYRSFEGGGELRTPFPPGRPGA